ncbi:hypothetical protein NQ315_004293 [Exocentrus adspersus]|uniref:Uncharacterized protein n=1 Tax=Exocentrus adspersus TaxID=1586481 RepID=A0AAV8W7L4_9CUCU|nr:hypothetical protein NQ315_004293 [Exocentrus adspersus]
MLSTLPLLLIITFSETIQGAHPLPEPEIVLFKTTRNQRSPEEERCCIIPVCTDTGLCSDTISCGYFCTSRPFQTVRHPNSKTPGYKLKLSYYKEDCRFGECRPYHFDCSHCPHPSRPDFNINAVRIDCSQCYYQ